MYKVTILPSEEWSRFSEKSHVVVFGEARSSHLDKIDYTLLVWPDKEVGGFMTIKEMDSETCYIQHGGVYPNYEKSVHVLKGYKAMLGYLKDMYKIIWKRIENTNTPMIKMALSQGFIINGCSLVKNKLYLELILEV